ncbi:uncharacterized protein LOC142571985 isoform X2 [Dermacentor variabilis]|uniref:uncharacterized protein LOC142571985 isoform X2 n=1 Tax=Dermacentor variabilis TaxID=34621 RepID=UPI003F5C89F5
MAIDHAVECVEPCCFLFLSAFLLQHTYKILSSSVEVTFFTEDPVSADMWRFSKAHRSQFIQAYRRLTDEQCMEVFPSHRERWRIQKVVGALETYPTQTIRGMAQLIGMSKTRVYETLRDAFSKLEDYGYD